LKTGFAGYVNRKPDKIKKLKEKRAAMKRSNEPIDIIVY